MAPQHRLYTPEIAETILERLADGEGLNAICRSEGMPSRGAVRKWIDTDHEGFGARYMRAHAQGIALLADDLIEISDDSSQDVVELPDGRKATDHEVVARARLRVDSRKWLLSKLIPKVYGDKVDVNHSGEMAFRTLPDERVESRIADLLGKAGTAGAVGGARTADQPAED
jgi:hypothetical protein